eukprot:3052016-Ditylum_brightwellii.AAC.1
MGLFSRPVGFRDLVGDPSTGFVEGRKFREAVAIATDLVANRGILISLPLVEIRAINNTSIPNFSSTSGLQIMKSISGIE